MADRPQDRYGACADACPRFASLRSRVASSSSSTAGCGSSPSAATRSFPTASAWSVESSGRAVRLGRAQLVPDVRYRSPTTSRRFPGVATRARRPAPRQADVSSVRSTSSPNARCPRARFEAPSSARGGARTARRKRSVRAARSTCPRSLGSSSTSAASAIPRRSPRSAPHRSPRVLPARGQSGRRLGRARPARRARRPGVARTRAAVRRSRTWSSTRRAQHVDPCRRLPGSRSRDGSRGTTRRGLPVWLPLRANGERARRSRRRSAGQVERVDPVQPRHAARARCARRRVARCRCSRSSASA